MPAPNGQVDDRQSTGLGILARIWWMFLGNVVLAFCILFIVENQGRFFLAADWVFWIGVASLVLVRYADIRFLDGCTVTGAYASVRHWIRYAALLVACSATVWALAHVASHILTMRATQGRVPSVQAGPFSSRSLPAELNERWLPRLYEFEDSVGGTDWSSQQRTRRLF